MLDPRNQRIQKLLRSDDGLILVQRLREKLDAEFRNIAVNTDLVSIGRNQGRIEVLNWMLSLRED